MTNEEVLKIENYLKKTFQLDTIEIRKLPKKDDTAEVYIADEFIGTMYRDDEDGDLSYQFQMAILDFDLES